MEKYYMLFGMFIIYTIIIYYGYNNILPIIVDLIDPKRNVKKNFNKINLAGAMGLIIFLFALSNIILGEPFIKNY